MKQSNNHKKKKIIIICIVFLSVLLIATFATYSYFAKSFKSDEIKKELFSSIANHDLEFFANDEIYAKIFERLKKDNYSSNSTITLSSTMKNDMFSNLDLSKFEFIYDVTKNNESHQMYSKFRTNYASTHLLTLDFILNKEQFALKSDEIVNRYVGTNTKNMQDLMAKLFNKKIDDVVLKKLKNFVLEREFIDFKTLAKEKGIYDYAKILENNTKAENISKKENVIINLNSEQVLATEYTISFNKNETSQLLNEISQKVKNDDKIIPELVVTNIQNFEEDNEILEYQDNDTFVQTSAEENNFESSIVVWGENTTIKNTTTEPQNTVENTTNTSQNQNVTNETQNAVSNNTTILQNTTNTIENTVIPPSIDRQEEPQPQPNESQDQSQPPQENSNQTNNQQPINEDENLRPQGFIQVNENEEKNENGDFLIGENLGQTLDNLVKLSTKIDWKSYLFTGARANFSQDEMVAQVQNLLTELMNENSSLAIKVYISENELIKMNFEMLEPQKSFDIEIVSKSENEKYLNISVLEGQTSEAKGYTVNLYRNSADANVKNSININKIEKGKITQKTILNLETKGTVNSKKFTTEIDFSYSDNNGEFKLNTNHALNFEVPVEVDELNDENCLFLDTLSEEQLPLIKEEIKQKMIEVLSAKNRNLNIMDINHFNSIVQQTQPQETQETNDDAKFEARDALIQTVANKMRDYQNEGRELQLQDLEGLEIPDYSVEISINSNLAIIVVNGYRFTLDADFNLSDS